MERQEIERAIVERVVDDALAAGCWLNVDNGGDNMELEFPTSEKHEIMKALFATDDDRLYLFKPGNKRATGWVWFIYGNSGWDVISDYTTNLEELLAGANKLSDDLEPK
jgi:hypothetical protein